MTSSINVAVMLWTYVICILQVTIMLNMLDVCDREA